jgi:hypothetical protein
MRIPQFAIGEMQPAVRYSASGEPEVIHIAKQDDRREFGEQRPEAEQQRRKQCPAPSAAPSVPQCR